MPISPPLRRRRRRPGVVLAALILGVAQLAVALVPVDPVIDRLREEHQLVYRSDQRHPTEVFPRGFEPNGTGTNENLLDHVAGLSNGDDTAFVSTTTDLGFAKDWQANAWVYEIVPAGDYVDVTATFEAAAGTADEAVRTEADRLLREYGYQSEWAAVGDIPRAHVVSAVPVVERDGEYVLDEGGRLLNVAFDADVTPRAARVLDPEELAFVPCTASPQSAGRLTAGCRRTVDPGEVRERHRATWEESGGTADLSLDASEVARGDKVIAPLPESAATLDALARGAGDASDGAWVSEFAGALERDLDTLEELSLSTRLLERVGGASARALSAGAELLPYAGLVATGYALEQDVASGDDTDLLFDGIAEGLQVAEAAQPEFVPFVEVALVVDIAVQQIVDVVRDAFGPSPAPPAWEREARKREEVHRAAWDDAPLALRQHFQDELETRMRERVRQSVEWTVGPRVDGATRHDLSLLDAARRAARTEVFRTTYAVAKQTGQPVASRAAALEAVDEAFRAQADDRVRARGGQLLDAADVLAAQTFAETVNGRGLVRYEHEFHQTVATPYVQALSDRLWFDFVNETRPPRVFSPKQQAFLDAKYAEEREVKLGEIRAVDFAAGLPSPGGRILAEDALLRYVPDWSELYAGW
ncbi:hypothetical protein [Frigoribacterium sp. ACAM 257]|uniref:scabin-related ADP-ribosyltransferase n=1 Tax=Frigoribacterium sp. ACAM 257 TaxID=2508998 RepID=UPI00174D19C8|nr:hypothetical protein [Frigoribacterium sp. ACAM 257]